MPPNHQSNKNLTFVQNEDSMMAYMLAAGFDADQDEINRNLRITFATPTDGSWEIWPAVYCKDLFADEIAQE